MSITGILLIILGGAVLAVGYILPARKEKGTESSAVVDENYIKQLLNKDLDDAKRKIADVVEETISYSIEKTERAVERLTNEKIMAINEYSDTVIETISKNHNEVIFLYDMLNDKHDNLVSTVSEANMAVNEIKKNVQNSEKTTNISAKTVPADQQGELMKKTEYISEAQRGEEAEVSSFTPLNAENIDLSIFPGYSNEVTDHIEELPYDESTVSNNNEKILRLYHEGKSKTMIAKELNLGVGEVKLVIELFCNK